MYVAFSVFLFVYIYGFEKMHIGEEISFTNISVLVCLVAGNKFFISSNNSFLSEESNIYIYSIHMYIIVL